mgnify:CR=1 FL=1
MKIRLPDTNDIMKSMQNTLKEWFKVMKEFSPYLVVYVGKTNTFDKAITNNSDTETIGCDNDHRVSGDGPIHPS